MVRSPHTVGHENDHTRLPLFHPQREVIPDPTDFPWVSEDARCPLQPFSQVFSPTRRSSGTGRREALGTNKFGTLAVCGYSGLDDNSADKGTLELGHLEFLY